MIRFADGDVGEEKVDLSATVDFIFKEGGTLEQVLGFEYRPEQYDMAKSISASLLKENHLLFEAGTGVGKSLAYLIPSILFSTYFLNKG